VKEKRSLCSHSPLQQGHPLPKMPCTSHGETLSMKWLHKLMLGGGAALLAVLVWKLGPAAVLERMGTLGWLWVPLILLEGLGEAMHTTAWRRCLAREHQGLGWVHVGMVRQAGMAFNYLTPTAHMGGEVVKGMLLGDLGGGVSAATSVIVGKLALVLSQLLFVSAGCLATLWSVPIPGAVLLAWAASTGLFFLGVGAFFWLQRKGKLGVVARALERKGLGGSPVRKAARWVSQVDTHLESFHRERPGDLVRAMGWHVAGFSCGIFQVWIYLGSTAQPSFLWTGAVIWFLGAWLDLVGFIVPAGLGVQEGSRALIFDLLGMSGASGLALGLVLRGTKGFWALVGLGCYLLLLRRGGRVS
jgi:hypothetical protein